MTRNNEVFFHERTRSPAATKEGPGQDTQALIVAVQHDLNSRPKGA